MEAYIICRLSDKRLGLAYITFGLRSMLKLLIILKNSLVYGIQILEMTNIKLKDESLI